MSRDQTLYQIFSGLDNPWLSYWQFSI